MRAMRINRRTLLGSAGGALGLAMLPARARATGITVPPAPMARVAVVRDTYFGETLSDPYRWMENDKDPAWLPFLKAQNDRTRAVLDAQPTRNALLQRISRLSGDTVSTSKVQRAGGKIFFQQRPLRADNYKLFVRDGGGTRVLIDPTALGGGAGGGVGAGRGHVSLDWWRASPDGARVVYGLSKDGSEDSLLHVMDVASGRDLSDRIPDTQGARPQWLDDGSGFFYNQLTGKVDTPERFLDSQARFHRIGTDPASDPVLMKRGLAPDVVFDRIQAPAIVTFPGSRHVLLILGDIRPEARILVAPLADVLGSQDSGRAPRWVPVADFADEVTDFEIVDGDLYLLANKGSPRGRIMRTPLDAPDLASAREVVAQGSLVIQGLSRARDGMYLKIMDGGIGRLRRLGLDGQVTDIALPFDGTIGTIFAEPGEPGVLLSLTGWLTPAGIWSVDPGGRVADTALTPKPPIDVSGYETRRFFATAKDGTRIPYSLIHKRGVKLDGRNPTWISAYGSYGSAAYTPSFQARQLALIDAGAIVGYANVRGGGEYGREWHKAGQLEHKPNTWRDLIAVCEDLVARKYTSPRCLAIGGRSAGGITVGRAMTERPDLFAAVIDGVGWSNPLRYVVEQNGYGEEPEWGAIAEEKGYRALKSIDSYQAVKDATAYPAVLLTTGVTDPRVAPFHVAKMTARLQVASSSGKPVLLRVDYDAGHGIGSTRAQQDREAADTYAFLLWQTAAI